MTITGLSSAALGLQRASARFDQSAQRIAATGVATSDPSNPTVSVEVGGLATETVQMATARFAFLSSVRAAKASLDMITEAVRLGGYQTR